MKTILEDIKMQSIENTAEGKPVLNTSEFSAFLNALVLILKEKTFKEEILEYKIQVDSNMAHVWIPYKFWFDGNLSYCVVNSF